MKIIAFITLFLANLALALPPHLAVVARKNAGGGGPPSITYLTEEGYEGTGAPTNWTPAGSPDWDYTTSPIAGSQSLATLGATNGSDTYAYYSFPSNPVSYVDIYVQFKPLDLPSANRPFIRIANSATTIATISITSTGTLTALATGGTQSSATVYAASVGSVHHLFLRYVKGAPSTITLGVSSDGTRPTSGDGFVQCTNGTSTDGANLCRLLGEWNSTAPGSVDVIWDEFKVALDQTIPSNP